MILEDKYRQEIDKVLYLKNVNKKEFRFSNILLFREYQSRLYAWKDKLGFEGEDFFNKKKPFHNLFIDLAPNWIKDLIPEEKIVKDLSSFGVTIQSSMRHFDGFYISMFLNWEIFKDTPEIQAHSDLAPPYDPVFKIISRGGSIFYLDMYLVIDYVATYHKHDGNFILPSSNEDFLNYVDQNCHDYPNQKLVNELWGKFKSIRKFKIIY